MIKDVGCIANLNWKMHYKSEKNVLNELLIVQKKREIDLF